MYSPRFNYFLPQPRSQLVRPRMHKPYGLTRRQFLKASMASTALLFTAACQPIQPVTESAAEGVAVAGPPNPIPGGSQLPDPMPFIHMYLPTPTIAPPGAPTISERTGDPATITDFSGAVGVFEPFGGTGTDNEGNTLHWAADVRFMLGDYIDVNGNQQAGAFAFI